MKNMFYFDYSMTTHHKRNKQKTVNILNKKSSFRAYVSEHCKNLRSRVQ